MITEEQVWKKLSEVFDPEVGMSIVDLGLIYDVNIKNDVVLITMTLTTPGCPLSAFFPDEVEKSVKRVKGVKSAKVKLTFNPPWTPERIKKK